MAALSLVSLSARERGGGGGSSFQNFLEAKGVRECGFQNVQEAKSVSSQKLLEAKALRLTHIHANALFRTSTKLQLNCEKRHQIQPFFNKSSYRYLWRSANTSTNSMVVRASGPEQSRILLSDVVVKKTRSLSSLFQRKWSGADIGTAVTVFGVHALCLLAPFTFTWKAFGVFVLLYGVTGLLGITLSYHRNLSHRSFKLPKWLEYVFAYCGAQAMQGDPLDWVSTHRYHHQFCDSDKDPHSPYEGFWFSHLSWMFDEKSMLNRIGTRNNVADLEKQPFYRFLRSTYIIHPIAMGLFLYALGGLSFVVWGMAVRIVWVYHITWFVNSACHVWGYQAWNTGDLSRNNWWVAALAFGEGWHNNHHAFEYSACHGLEWWQLDPTWYVIRILEAVRLATDVRLPSEQHKARMSFMPEG